MEQFLFTVALFLIGYFSATGFKLKKKEPEVKKKQYTIYFKNGEYADVDKWIIDGYLERYPQGSTTSNIMVDRYIDVQTNQMAFMMVVNDITFIEKNW